jgi:DNA repair exonuclease SbcCD ATPase subunit
VSVFGQGYSDKLERRGGSYKLMGMHERKKREHEYFLEIYPDRESLGLGTIQSYVDKLKSKGMTVSPEWVRKHIKREEAKGSEVDREFAEFIESLKKSSKVNAQSARLYAQLKGYTEKTKEESAERGITPAEYLRAGQELIRQFRLDYQEHGGICPVCSKPCVLPDDLCDNQVN